MGPDVQIKTDGTTKGRDSGAGGSPLTGGAATTTCYTSRQGSVVIRATVEHIGVVGDTEMTVSVKWPASNFCAPCCQDSSCSDGQSSNAVVAPKNGPGAYILHAGNSGGSTPTSAESDKQGASGLTDSSEHKAPGSAQTTENPPEKTVPGKAAGKKQPTS
jgi:hypothetical protein